MSIDISLGLDFVSTIKMAWLGNLASTVFRNINKFAEQPANKVIQVNLEDYYKRHVHCREDGTVLYFPEKEKEKYEIVLQKPCTETLKFAYR